MMPGLDGWAVLSKLKEDPSMAEIPVVMLTIVDDKQFGYALGATEYLTKPVDRELLGNVIRKLRQPSAPGRALVIDDDPETRELLSRTLQRQGWTTAIAEDGRIALDAMATQKPDLILLDLLMPRLDGFEFVSELRKRQDWRSIPIIVITAKTLTNEDRLVLQDRVWKVLEKGGFSRDKLLAELREIVGECVSALSGRNRSANLNPSEVMPKILLVEDNEMNRDMLSRRLQRKGYEVVMATRWRTGRRHGAAESPALILMDMSLPVLDGWEATRRIKAAPETTRSRHCADRPRHGR